MNAGVTPDQQCPTTIATSMKAKTVYHCARQTLVTQTPHVKVQPLNTHAHATQGFTEMVHTVTHTCAHAREDKHQHALVTA